MISILKTKKNYRVNAILKSSSLLDVNEIHVFTAKKIFFLIDTNSNITIDWGIQKAMSNSLEAARRDYRQIGLEESGLHLVSVKDLSSELVEKFIENEFALCGYLRDQNLAATLKKPLLFGRESVTI